MTVNTLLVSAQMTLPGDTMDRGISIAVSGLLIVFTALLLISLFIASLPMILSLLARAWPEVDDPHHRHVHHESQVDDNDHVLAAIGFVLHTELQKQLRNSDETSGAKD